MIISHLYEYLFIEIPVTASWAIRNELCEQYGGEPILHKHASWIEFQKVATESEKTYCTFATVRNPLDITVSGFYKLKTNHGEAFTDPQNLYKKKVTTQDILAYKRVQESGINFKEHFLESSNRPYDSMIALSAEHLDFVIRYENLQNDFSRLLTCLNIEPVRPIPVLNQTGSRRRDWRSYYDPDMYIKAGRKFGPFMNQWSYDFPEGWGNVTYRKRDEWLFKLLGIGRRIYMTNFRYGDSRTAHFARSFRARFW